MAIDKVLDETGKTLYDGNCSGGKHEENDSPHQADHISLVRQGLVLRTQTSMANSWENDTIMDYTKASNAIADTFAKIGEPLTETQRIVLAGSVAVFLEQMFITSWNAAIEKSAKTCDELSEVWSDKRFAEAIRKFKSEEK